MPVITIDKGYFNARSIDNEDGLPDCKGTVVPDDQEHEDQVQHSVVQKVIGNCQNSSYTYILSK